MLPLINFYLNELVKNIVALIFSVIYRMTTNCFHYIGEMPLSRYSLDFAVFNTACS